MKELIRTATFANCSLKLEISPFTLSRLGYEYNSKASQIQCSGCAFKPRVLQLSLKEIIIQHQNGSPNCPFSSVVTELPTLDQRDATGNYADSGLDTSSSTHRVTIIPCCTNVIEANERNVETVRDNLESLVPSGQNERLQLFAGSTGRRQNLWSDTNRNNSSPVTIDSGYQNTTASEQTDANLPCNLQVVPIPEESEETIKGSRAKSVNYVRKDKRIESFDVCLNLCLEQRNWLISKKYEMAEAGFYYSAECSDCVRCFFCDVGVRFSRTSLEPWREHSRWNCNCKYLQKYKSGTFILSCQKPERWWSARYRPPRLESLNLIESL